MTCSIDDDHGYIFDWINSVDIDSAVIIRKLDISIWLNIHSMSGKFLCKNHHIISVNVLQRILKDKVWISYND